MASTFTLNKETNRFQIVLGPEQFYKDLALVKSLPVRSYEPATKLWTVPASPLAERQLKAAGFVRKDEVPRTAPESAEAMVWTPVPVPRKPVDRTKLDHRLYPYQIEGVEFLEAVDGRGILGDGMRVGKSVQSISYLRLHPELRPALIVTTASMKVKWQREVRTWAAEDSWIWPEGAWNRAGIFIINYEQLQKYERALCEFGFKIILADECQKISNTTAKRTKAFLSIYKSMGRDRRVIPMSGTPIRNRPGEFFTVLNMVAPQEFPNRYRFLQRYCAPEYSPWGWQYKGASNLEELHARISPFMIRRNKEEVWENFPARQRIVLPLELDNVLGGKYHSEDEAFMRWLSETKRKYTEVANKLAVLRTLAYQAKRKALFQWYDDWLEDNPEEKIVVFAFHLGVLDDLQAHFGDACVRIDGSVSSSERQGIEDRFHRDPATRVFLGQINAAGEGMDLSVSSTVSFVELCWVPADILQAEDRVANIMRENKIATYFLVAEGSVEDDMAGTLIEKFGVVSSILDGKSDGALFDEDYMSSVLQRRKERKGATK